MLGAPRGRGVICRRRYVVILADGIHLQAAPTKMIVLIGARPRLQATGRLHRWRPRERAGLARSARPEAAPAVEVPPRVWPSPMARSGFWNTLPRRKRASSAAGCTRPPTYSPSCRRASSRKPNARCRKSGWPKPRPSPSWRSTPSSRATRPNTRRRPTAGEGSRRTAGFLRLPRQAPATNRRTTIPSKTSANRAPPHDPIEGMPVQQNGARDGLQAARDRAEKLRSSHGHNQLPKLVLGVTFNNGIEVIAKSTDRQPTTAAA